MTGRLCALGRCPTPKSGRHPSPWANRLLRSLALAGAALPGGLTAQEPPLLTLEEALARAEAHNPSFRSTRHQLRLSGMERELAVGQFLPTLNFSTSTGVSLNRQLVSTDVFGLPVANPITEWRTSSSTSQSLSGRISLWDWGARFRGLATQKARARAREAAVTAASRTLRATVVRRYRAAQYQLALQAVEANLLQARLVDLETTRRRFELAGAGRVEVLIAELQVREQESRIEEVKGQLETALLALRTAIGDETLLAFRVSEALPQPFDPGFLDEGDLVRRALASSPALLEQESAVNVARAEAANARASRWPPLALGFSANQSSFGDQLTSVLDLYPDRSRAGGVSFGITVPLFPRLDTKASIVQAEVQLANAQERLREARLRVEEEVRSRFIALQTARRSYLLAVQSRSIAQERLTLAREQYRLGTRTFTELQQDIEAAARAERQVIHQLFALEQALTNLEEVVGEELR